MGDLSKMLIKFYMCKKFELTGLSELELASHGRRKDMVITIGHLQCGAIITSCVCTEDYN